MCLAASKTINLCTQSTLQNENMITITKLIIIQYVPTTIFIQQSPPDPSPSKKNINVKHRNQIGCNSNAIEIHLTHQIGFCINQRTYRSCGLVQTLSTAIYTTIAKQLLYVSIRTNHTVEFITIVICKFLHMQRRINHSSF